MSDSIRAKIAVIAIIAALWNFYRHMLQESFAYAAVDSLVFGISITLLVYLYHRNRSEA